MRMKAQADGMNENNIAQQHFLNPFFALWEETFESHHGIYLDANTSLFQTLESINAITASIPVGKRCASLAAQVAHITFYLEVLERIVRSKESQKEDWGDIWRRVEQVTTEDWDRLRLQLREAYQRCGDLFRSNPSWNEESVGGVMAVLVHSAYHLGEIRQALCILEK